MKKRWFACICVLVLVWGAQLGALGENYPARNLFFDEDYISNVAVANGRLYALFDSGLTRVEPDGSIVPLGPVEAAGWISAFASDGEDLYALDQTEDGWRLLCLPVTEEGIGNVSSLSLALPADVWARRARVDGDTFWLMYSLGAEVYLSAWPLSGDAEQSWPVKNVQDFELLGDGRVLVLRQEQGATGQQYSLRILDPANGQETSWAAWEENVGNCLAYDADQQTAYLFGRSSVYTVQPQGKPAYLDSFLAGDVVSVALLDTGAALVVDGMLVVRDFTKESARRLRVLCDHGRGEEYRDFVEAHPEIDLQFISPTLGSCEEQFTQDMLLGNSLADVYILEDLSLLAAIKEKGYFADMGQDAGLAALAEEMYPAFQSTFCDGEAVAAFPKDVFLEVLCYYKPLFTVLDMEPPATYAAYFDFCLAWLGGLDEEFPNMALRPFANGLDLESLLIRYANEQMRQGVEPVFATEELAALVEQYFSVEKAYAQAETAQGTTVSVFASYTLPLWGAEDDYGYLPLSFGGEATLTPAQGDVSYFVINPYGENQRDAMALVAAYNDWRAEVGQALLFSSVDQPIESKLYADEHAAMEKTLARLEAELAQADPENQRDLEMQIKEQQARMSTLETEERWAITQGALETYRDLSKLVWLNPYNAVPFLWDNLPRLDANASRQDIAAFLETLDQRWRIFRLEEGAGETR